VEWVHTIIPGSLQKATESSDRPGFLSRARQHRVGPLAPYVNSDLLNKN
jgi:hypothetical protein